MRITDKGMLHGLHSYFSAPRVAMQRKTSRLKRTWRVVRLVVHLSAGVTEVALTFRFRSEHSRTRAIGSWSRRLLKVLGVEVAGQGSIPEQALQNTVLVANHISWIDIFALNAVTVSRFVAKSEVRRWPVIGWLSHNTGTLFVAREKRHDTVKVNRAISHALSAGNCIAVFPEGSTTDGRGVKTFNASLLQPAVDASSHVIPVAIRYLDHHGQETDAAAYIGDMSLVESILKLVSEPRIIAHLQFFDPIDSANQHRRDIAKTAEKLIGDALNATQDAD